ncbi:MAG: hypothetical protein AAGF72_19520 [Pseudomonadota bacterium]
MNRLALLVTLLLIYLPANAGDQSLPAGETAFVFSDWNGPSINVRLFVPDGASKASPIVVVIHGWSRDIERYYEDWSALADENGFIAVVPHYPFEDFPTANEFNQGHVFDAETGDYRPADSWTFASVEAVFDEVVARLGSDATDYTIYGHSAGSQFVHRYLWHVPGARVKRYLAANAGWYTMPDYTVDYPYGLRNANISREQLIAALARDVVVMLGDRDTETQSSSLRNTAEAKAQGANRYLRGLRMYATAKSAAEKLGVEFGWSLRIVEGAAHVNAEMAVAAAELVE